MIARTNTLRTELFGIGLALVVALGVAATARADTILLSEVGFEADSYTAGSNLTGQPTASNPKWQTLTWTGSSASVTDAVAFTGQQSVLASNNSNLLDFNTNSTVGNHIVRVEGYMRLEGTSGYSNFGLLEPGSTTTRQASLVIDGSHNLTFRNANGDKASDNFAATRNQWYHVAIEVNYQTDEASVWAKAVDAGDKSALTQADRVTFNHGADTIAITPGTNAYAGRLFLLTTNPGEGYFDDVSVTAVPEPGSLALLGLGGLTLLSRKRRSR